MSQDWARFFPDADYRPAMNLRLIDGREFFVTRSAEILEMRRVLLRTAPEFYRAGRFDTASLSRFLELPEGDPAGLIEPDWVLLRPGEGGVFLVESGCVCFPTMWSFPEKIGLPLAAVHDPVPGLNVALETKIDQFLSRLSFGTAYGRENWGLSASPQLDQHPRHRLPAIAAEATLDQVWLRIEEQALLRLDDGQILFGIRLLQRRLDEMPLQVAPRLARALRTMPEAMAAYKRLSACRSAIAQRLQG